VTNSKRILFGINLLDFSFFLLIDLEAEVKFFLGTIRKTVLSHVINKVFYEMRIVLFWEMCHTKIGGSFGEELHYK